MVADLCENFNFRIEHFNIEYYRQIFKSILDKWRLYLYLVFLIKTHQANLSS